MYLIFKFMGLEPRRKSFKDSKDSKPLSGGTLNRDPQQRVRVSSMATTHMHRSASAAYSGPKAMAEVALVLAELDANAAKETWRPCTTSKKKGKEPTPIEGTDIRLSLRFEVRPLFFHRLSSTYFAQETLVLPGDKYDGLTKILFSDNFDVLVQLGRAADITPAQRVEIAEHLIIMAELKVLQYTSTSVSLVDLVQNVAPKMIAALIVDEISRTPQKQILFRANSIASKALDFYQKLVCGEWLAKLFRLVDTIATEEDKSCEVVTSKMTPEDNLDANLKLLLQHVTTAYSAITEAKARCPASLRTIYHAMFEESVKKFNAAEDVDVRYTAVSGFLFLRLFVPAIMVLYSPTPHTLTLILDTQAIRSS